MNLPKTAIVIAGPTASGKSALALKLAHWANGVIINADSMQVYSGLAVITAQPDAAALAELPHKLYGVLAPLTRCSVALWLDMARREIEAAFEEHKTPIIVGGTGLYLRALMEGLANVPSIPEDVRAAARSLHEKLGAVGFHAALALRDPVTAARLEVGDTQRLLRAWEVIEATGASISEWQSKKAIGAPEDVEFLPIVLIPPRDSLYVSCDGRFLAMMEAGALDEARLAMMQNYPDDLPAMKALGMRELWQYLSGDIEREAAIASAQQATRNYAKRQITWFKHQLIARHDCLVIDKLFTRNDSDRIMAMCCDWIAQKGVIKQ